MISYTGIAYVAGSLAFGFLTFRFYQYYMREVSVFSKTMFFFSLSFLIFTVYTAAASLFFPYNSQILKSAVVVATLFQGLGASFLAYLIFFMKISRVSPRLVLAVFFVVTLVTTFVSATSKAIPSFDPVHSAVDWGVPVAEDLPRAVMFFLTFVPMGAIFVQQFFSAKSPEMKMRAFGLGALLIVGSFIAAVDFILERLLNLGLATGDIAQTILYVALLGLLVATQKPPAPRVQEG
jgi:hypothetical protein